MSETPGETYLDRAGMQALSATLARGATVLDEAGARAPHAPVAGVSTPLVGALLAGMSGAVGDLVAAVDVTAVNVRRSDETLGSADSDGAQQFTAFDE
ncbi:MAG: hypothetical protein ABR608_09150 [Pseudonocardiaceae bacterium]